MMVRTVSLWGVVECMLNSRQYNEIGQLVSARQRVVEVIMHLEDYFDFSSPDVIRIKGHRIGIEHILELYKEGYSPEMIALEFPGLSLEKIHATITYYLHNQAEVDAYIQRGRDEAEREYRESAANPSPLVERLRAVRKQLAQQAP